MKCHVILDQHALAHILAGKVNQYGVILLILILIAMFMLNHARFGHVKQSEVIRRSTLRREEEDLDVSVN